MLLLLIDREITVTNWPRVLSRFSKLFHDASMPESSNLPSTISNFTSGHVIRQNFILRSEKSDFILHLRQPLEKAPEKIKKSIKHQPCDVYILRDMDR